MWTYEAERVIDAAPEAVSAALASVVERVWASRARLVANSAASGRVDAIAGERDDSDVWLTWYLEQTGAGTRVRVVLDEVEPGPDPADELVQLLELVVQQLEAGELGTAPSTREPRCRRTR